MKALTIRQPWAGLIAIGAKPVENRSWRTTHRGLVAVHAGASPDLEAMFLDHVRVGFESAFGDGQAFPDAARVVIAVATLDSIHTDDAGCCLPWGMPGQEHWMFTGVRRLAKPVKCKGALGLWTLPAEVDAAVLMQLSAVAR